MEHLSNIDFLGKERFFPSPEKRKLLLEARLEEEREAGYQQLWELCSLGEYDAASLLAKQNPQWRYEVVEGEVRVVGHQ